MQRYREVKDEIGINQQLKMLMQAYQEHAIVQINFARYSVVSSREFMQELAEIFTNVKASYQAVIAAKQKKSKKKENDPFAKNGKDALVLLSSNGKFYGDLVTKVCRIFEEQARNTDADIVIVGKEGRSYYESTKIHKPFTYFELPDTNVPLALLEPVIQKLVSYERVTIFYGKFDNIIVQEPVKANLSGDLAPTAQGGKQQEEFLFEPSVENVMAFFESQIFSLLLNQTVNEGKLARFASRIKAMEIAQNNLQKQLKFLNSREKRLKSMEMNKKQLQLFAGRSLWNK